MPGAEACDCQQRKQQGRSDNPTQIVGRENIVQTKPAKELVGRLRYRWMRRFVVGGQRRPVRARWSEGEPDRTGSYDVKRLDILPGIRPGLNPQTVCCNEPPRSPRY